MQKYNYEITIEANSSQDAETILRSAITLMKKLKPNEIRKLADVVANDPVKTALAKRAMGL